MPKYYDLPVIHKSLLQAEGLCGQIYNNLCIMVNFEQDDIDPIIMEKAINTSIIRFPSTYLRRHDFKENGKKVTKEYLVDKPESQCRVMSFDDDKKMYKFINKLVRTPFPNKYCDCDLYRIVLIKKANGRLGMLVCMYHFIADAYSIIKFSDDVCKVYTAMKNGTEMPKPFEPLPLAYQLLYDYEKSEKHERDIKFWQDFWKSVTPPQFSTINGFHDKYAYIPGEKYGNYLNIFNVKAVQSNYKISKELTDRCFDFSNQYNISVKILYLLAIKTYLSKQTNGNEAFNILDLLANRSKKIEANTGGSLAESKNFYFDAKNSMTFLEACLYTAKCQSKYYKHARIYQAEMNEELYKAVNLVKTFDKGWVRGTSAIMFTYQPYINKISSNDDIKLSVERFTTGKSPMPMYITVMPTDNYTGEMNINYEYMTKLHKEEDVAAFHNYIVRFLDKATSDPSITLGELMNI